MMKKLFGILATLLIGAQSIWAKTTVTTADALYSAVTNNQTVTLGQDITLTNGRLDIDGTTVTLDLNGHTLTRQMAAADAGGQVIAVMNGGKLTITDSKGGGTITGGWAYQGAGIYVYEGCSLTISGGTISGNRADQISGGGYGYGGGVENHGTLNITGGSITGNTAGQFGGGIHNEGTLNISGGSIANNTAGEHGGGIYNIGSATISGATISGNTAQSFGGAICSGGELTLNGVTITGNSANQYGGGIYMFKPDGTSGTVQLQGACTITGNTAQAGGGIFQSTNGNAEGPTLKMQDKPVVDNNSPNDVYLQSYQFITVTGLFSEGTHIGVDTEVEQEVFTTGYGAHHDWHIYDPQQFFFVSNPVLNGTIGTKTTDDSAEAYLTHTTYKVVTYIERSWDSAAKKVTEAENTCTGYTVISGNDTSDDGWFGLEDNVWYVVVGSASRKVLNVLGTNAHLIIPDGTTLTVTGGVKVEQGHKLTIYGQTHDTGRLIANSSAYESAAGIGSGINARAGDVTIHGGTIQATGNHGSTGIGTGGPPQRHHVKNGGGTVVIYGGNVTATGGGGGAGIGGGAELDLGSTFHFYMYGGTVTAQGGSYGGAGIGGGGNGGGAYGKVEGSTVDIYGGTLTATGGYDDYTHNSGAGIGGGDGGDSGMKVHIHGGTVTAQCGSFDGDGKRAIGPGDGGDDYGELTIADDLMVSAGYSAADSAPFTADLRVTACQYRPYAVIAPCTHYNPTYAITDGTTHTTTCIYCSADEGRKSEAHVFGSDGRCACGLLALQDMAVNSAVFLEWSEQPMPIVLTGRTLFKDGLWNTLCLPFDVTVGEGSTLAGGTAMTLNTETSNFNAGTLTLNFQAAPATIPAGTPFIIKWDGDGTSNIENPMFVGATINTAADNYAVIDGVLTFQGTYGPITFGSAGDNTVLYLGSGNTLYYPDDAMTIGACRAYFQLADGITAGESSTAGAKSISHIVLNFGDGVATGVTNTDFTDDTDQTGGWYDLSGRRLAGQPSAKGIYINNGIKVVIK